ncbi:hypothetical protein ACFOEE_18820 [Pseudoalteromonas fenneropenaei]|uniref:DUF4194 domain-containing protein n=1 Tax=Pseudoalteromonas fenneropenaei TaxID=1737459 RepID=A0ABV7CPL7_9GAMM
MTTINLNELTELQAIHKKLASGCHISEQDTTQWQQLDQHMDAYEALFASLGQELKHDSRGFFYFAADESTPNMGKTSRSFALTIYVLIEHFANLGKDPLRALFDEVIDLELMQTLVQMNKHLFDQLELFSGSELRKDVYGRMVRFGLAREVENGYQHLAPVYRYIDALMEVNETQIEGFEDTL